jgi:hypothetical protein
MASGGQPACDQDQRQDEAEKPQRLTDTVIGQDQFVAVLLGHFANL